VLIVAVEARVRAPLLPRSLRPTQPRHREPDDARTVTPMNHLSTGRAVTLYVGALLGPSSRFTDLAAGM